MNRTGEVVLKATDIWKSYGQGDTVLSILRGIELEVREGQVIAITGPSGSGKSTLLHILGLLDRPDGGTVTIANEDPWNAGENRRATVRNHSIGFVFQFHHLLEEFTIEENIAIPSMLAGRSRTESLATAADLIAEVDLTSRKTHFPSQVSGGERQRTAVARSLVCSPSVVLADEPTGNLDSATSERVENLIFRLAENRKQAFVMATHSMALAERAHVRYHLSDGLLHGL